MAEPLREVRSAPKPAARGIVARGRTVKIGDKHFGPGAEITVPEDEMAWLRGLGYVIDPGAKAPEIVQDGTATIEMGAREGPHVSRVAS